MLPSVGITTAILLILRSPDAGSSSDFLLQSASHVREKRDAKPDLDFIPPNYSTHELPPQTNGSASEMTFGVLIMDVRDIKEINEEITAEMNMYITWSDTRFGSFVHKMDGDTFVLQPQLLGNIWHPDIFFERLKQVTQPNVVSKPASLRIFNDSSLRYAARIALTVHCEMDFYYYPADTQRCNFDLKSYAYNDKQLRLAWRAVDGATFGRRIPLSNFYLGLEKPSTFSFTTISGTFPGLRFTILLERKLSFHLIQTYIPSALLVAVSWLSFLVPPDSVPGRMAICVTCLLTLVAMFASVRQMVPNVSYVKALDIWMVCCVIFVFCALAEFTVILKLLSIKKSKRVLPPSNPSSIELKDQVAEQKTAAAAAAVATGGQVLYQDVNVYKQLVAKIEKRAPLIMPTLFVVFNLCYWTWLLSSNPSQIGQG